jgi:hypothetical protein
MSFSQKEYQKLWRAKNPNYHKDWAVKNPEYYKKYYTSLNKRATRLIAAAKYRAKKKNAKVTITLEWLISKLKTGVCEITNLPFDFSLPNSTKNNLNSPSLDRIDSSNPNYTLENTRVVLWAVNRLHGDDTLESLSPILEKVLDYLKNNSTPSLSC